MQEGGQVQVPFLPKLLEQLSRFSRPNKPLTTDEFVMIHQINVFVQDLVANDKLPEQFLSILPENVTDAALRVYDAWDKPLYPETQREIAMKLL